MQLATAIINGRHHRLMQQNGHDFAVAGQPANGYAFGLVLDGCGSRYRDSDPAGQFFLPAQSEVGSKLIGRFAAEWLHSNLVSSPPRVLETTLATLFDDTLQYIAGLVDTIPFATEDSRRRFVFTHMLATMIGFILTPSEAAFFWSGDGYLCQDGQVSYLDNQNQPDYLVHHFFEGWPDRFNRRPIEQHAQLGWLAVATDGWDAELLARVAPDTPALDLQRWLNMQARNNRYFEDDAAIALWRNSNQGRQQAMEGHS